MGFPPAAVKPPARPWSSLAWFVLAARAARQGHTAPHAPQSAPAGEWSPGTWAGSRFRTGGAS